MTDNTKMREEFERWAEGYDIRLVRDGVFADDYADGDAEIAWRAWQAAQAVPVVGEPVAWVNEYCIDEWERSQKDNWSGARLTAKEVPGSTVPLFRKPTHSIPAPELERLRKDAERYQAVVIISQASLCIPSTRTEEANRMISAYQAAVNAGLGLEPAIDEAMKERQS